MRMVAGILLLGLGAGGAMAADRFLLEPEADPASVGSVSQTEQGPGDPPLVWVDGTLEAVSGSEILLRDGDGPRLTVERFAGGATRFFRRSGDNWVQLEATEATAVGPGPAACVEALLDGETFLAVRVFLDASCTPA